MKVSKSKKKMTDDDGSMAPLGIGFALISLTLVFSILAAGSLFVFQKRLKNYSESVALYVAESGATAQEFLDRAGPQKFKDFRVSSTIHQDALTVEATSCASWDFAIPILFPTGPREICAQASARLEQLADPVFG